METKQHNYRQYNFRCSDEFLFQLEAVAKVNKTNKAQIIRDLVSEAYKNI